MQRIVPLPPIQLAEHSPIYEAMDIITWAQGFAVNLLTTPRPRWWVEIGLGEDFEDTAALQTMVGQCSATLSKLRAIENGASCQDAPLESIGGDQPTQF